MMFGRCPKSPKITWKSWDYSDIGYVGKKCHWVCGKSLWKNSRLYIPVWITIGKTRELIFI